MNHLILTVCNILVFQLLFIQQDTPDCYKNISSDDFNLFIETQEVLLLDVRLYKEFRKERLFYAKAAPNRESLECLLHNYDKEILILVYCDESDRGKTASQIICQELGFKKVYNLKGGIINWKKKGYPIDQSRIRKQE